MIGQTNAIEDVNPIFLYTRLEYIESTGIQYIDTGVVPKNTTRAEIKLKFNEIDGSQAMGWGSSGNQEAFIFGIDKDNFCSYVSSNYIKVSTGIPKNTLVHIFDVKSGSQKFDGIEYGTDTIGNTASSGQTLYLFATHAEWDTAPWTMCKCNLYYCKICDGDTLVRDFIPVLDENNIACLYDRVTKTYFYNKGSGSFNAGPVIQ